MRLADGGMLGLVDSGDRLTEMQARLDESIATGVRVAELHTFDKMLLGVYELGDGQQGTAMSIVGSGTVAEVTYDPTGVETGRTERAFDATFVLRQIAGDRWLTVAVEPG